MDYNGRPVYETAEEYNQARRQDQQAYEQPQERSSGTPMQNHFVIQLVFAIVEILLCVFSPVTMVLAIIALVFAVQANSAYKTRKEIDFQVKSKVANILLIVGGAFAAFSVVLLVLIASLFVTTFHSVMHEVGQIYNGDVDAFVEDIFGDYENRPDSGAYTENLHEGDVPLADGFDTFSMDGRTYSVPMSYEDFMKMGFVMDKRYDTLILEPGEYEAISINHEDGSMQLLVRFSNHTNVVLPLQECEAEYLYFNNDAAYDASLEPMDLRFADGLDLDCSYEDVTRFMGEPTTRYVAEADGYENYMWYYEGETEYQSFSISFLKGKVCDICFERYEY